MNELTITQLTGIVGIAYSLWQISGARASHAAEIAELRTKVSALESGAGDTARTLTRIEENVTQISTTLARLEERLTALDQKIERR